MTPPIDESSFTPIQRMALNFLRRGWQPTPLDGKKPFLSDWQQRVLTEDDVPVLFAAGRNIGLVHGDQSGGLIDVDLDCPEAVRAGAYLLPPTPMLHGRGKAGVSHFAYLCPGLKIQHFTDPEPPTGQKAALVDLLGSGSQTMMPPSVHPETKETLQWAPNLRFEPPPVGKKEIVQAVGRVAAAALIARRWHSGARSELAMFVAGWLAKSGVSREDAEQFVTAICRGAGDEETSGRITSVRHTYDVHGRGEAVKGASELIDRLGEKVLRRAEEWLLGHSGRPATAGNTGGLGTGGKDERKPGVNRYAQQIQVGLELTDAGNARRFLKLHGAQVLHCEELGGWFVWDGRRWERDTRRRALRLACDTAADIATQAQEIKFPLTLTDGTIVPTDHASGWSLHWAKTTNNAQRIAAMLDLASSATEVAITAAELDADPLLLNVQNGVLRLDSDTLLEGDPLTPHDPGLRISKLAPALYDPQAECPLWLRFLDRIFGGDAELCEFMQRFTGYLLTGGNPEHKIAFLWGTGGNGKGRFLHAIASLLGDYATSARSETILAREKGSNNQVYMLAQLKGARLVRLSETDEGARLAEAMVKDMTGGDPISARVSHGNFFTFEPEFTPLLATNDMPELSKVDEAIRRRVLLIPFKVTIPDEEKDPELDAKLEVERSGILNWALDGLRQYYILRRALQPGLTAPPCVLAATAEYLAGQDATAEFVTECCVLRADLQAQVGDVFRVYRAWCEANARRYKSKNQFGQAIAQILCQTYGHADKRAVQTHSGSIRWWLGLGLTEDAAALASAPDGGTGAHARGQGGLYDNR